MSTQERAERCYKIAAPWNDASNQSRRIDAIAREIQAAADEALEEAEHECRREAARNGPTDRQIGAENCAERIQRLRLKSAAAQPSPGAERLHRIEFGTPEWYADQEERTASLFKNQGHLTEAIFALESRLSAIAKAAPQ